MTNEFTHGSARAGAPATADARASAVSAVLVLLLAYVGFLLGAPVPEFRAGPALATVHEAQGWQHLAGREGSRAVAAAEQRDPRVPAPPPSPGFGPDGTAVFFSNFDRFATAARPSASPVAAARRAHAPRAPPSVPA